MGYVGQRSYPRQPKTVVCIHNLAVTTLTRNAACTVLSYAANGSKRWAR